MTGRGPMIELGHSALGGGSEAAVERRGLGKQARRAGVCALLILSACSSAAREPTEGEKIVSSVLGFLSSRGQTLCLDDETQDKSLAVFKEMALAPRPSREQLHWFTPSPLVPDEGNRVQNLAIRRINDAPKPLVEPGHQIDQLAPLMAYTINSEAKRFALGPGAREESVKITKPLLPNNAVARWWPINRFKKDCSPLFVISHPIYARNLAFVTVRADHWGTTYALQREGKAWLPIGEWSRWLY